MTTTHSIAAADSYTGRTEGMQADPEARHPRDAASESSLQVFPIQDARCATYPTQMNWVPDRELRLVPELMAALCRRCPGRSACLLWALAGNEHGYWAGTTTADRKQMGQLGRYGIQEADRLQETIRQGLASTALHEPGDGSYRWYRRQGCRCLECKSANASQRATERAKARAAA